MTVGNASDGASSERSGPFYVRLRNLPVNATQKHIRDFFSDLTILDGGISIHRNFSFVVFKNEKDAVVALSKDHELLHGKKVSISNAVLKDVQRTRVKEARKKLVFSPPEQVTMLKQKKRIRPTNVKACLAVVAPKRFCPDEIEYPMKNHVTYSMDIKATELMSNNKTLIENGLRLHDDKVARAESKPNALIENLPDSPQDKVPKHAGSTLLLKSIDKPEVDLKGEKNVENSSGSCFLKKFNSDINESSHLEESIFVQGNTWQFLDEKIPNNKDEISSTNENHLAKVKLEGKVAGQAGSSAFPKKVRDVTNKFPAKKTIKPTSVLTMNLFKMAYEGTVF